MMVVMPLPKEVRCILYNDIVESTNKASDASRRGEETAHSSHIEQWYRFWREALEAEGAVFIKFMGDGLIATFLDVQRVLPALARAYIRLGQGEDTFSFPTRFGLHIGAVSIREDGDIVGAEAAIGQRVMCFAHPGQVLMSETFAEHARPCLPPDFTLRYVGARRLKGFGNTPERLYQLCAPGLPDDFPPVPLSQSEALPIYLDVFVGRKNERRELRSLLKGQRGRCITLLGAPGCGKTRLAVQAARDALPDFADGVYYVALEETNTPEGVLARIAAALSISLRTGADIRSLIVDACENYHLLLVLDNFEQAIAAAGQVSALLRELPNLHILVTSRERLRIQGEQTLRLEPLATPTLEDSWLTIKKVESARLFELRARAANKRFRLTEANAADVAWLCRQLEGLPMALEIVAAEAHYVPLAQLRAEFQELLHRQTQEEVAPRHRSLRATFDYSYERLNSHDQLLFCQLGLFETAFHRAQVLDICTGSDVEGGLRRLQDKSLLQCDLSGKESEYRLLIPAREYARFRLGEPEDRLQQRFIAAFTRRAEALHEIFRRSEAPNVLLELQADMENYQAAWRMALQRKRRESITRLGMALTFFAPILPLTSNIAAWVDDTESAFLQLEQTDLNLEAAGRFQRARCLGKLKNTRARLSNLKGEFVQAVKHQQEALWLLSQFGSEEDAADAASTLAFFALRALDADMAEHHAHLAIEKAQACGALVPEAFAFYVLACLATPCHVEQAARMAERSLDLFRQAEDPGGIAHAMMALGGVAEARSEWRTAELHYREALRLRWEYRAEDSVARCLEALGKFYARRGKFDQAHHLLLAAARTQKTLGMPETARLALPQTEPQMPGNELLRLPRMVEQVLEAACITP